MAARLTFAILMADEDEILQVVFIGVAVASILLQTCRFIKAIELFSECLVLLKKHSLKLKKDKLNKLFALVYDRLFNLYCLVGNYKNAIQSGEEALCLSRENDDYEGEAVLLKKLGDVYLSIGENKKAKESFEKALTYYLDEVSRLKQGENSKRTLATLLCNLGEYSIPLLEFTSAKDYFEQALAIWEEIGDMQEKERALNVLSELTSLVSDSKKAAQNEEQAIPIYETGGSESGAGLQKAKAKDYLERAREVFRETGNRKNEPQVLIALGNLYKDNEEYEQARISYEEAMVIAEDVGDTYDKGVACGKLGVLCNIRGEYVKAKELHMKALEMSVSLGDKRGEIEDHLHFAKVHINLSENNQARECYRKALEISKEIGSQEAEASTFFDLGVFSLSLSDYENAELNFKKALELYRKIGDTETEGSTICQLGYLYFLVGGYHEAIKCYER